MTDQPTPRAPEPGDYGVTGRLGPAMPPEHNHRMRDGCRPGCQAHAAPEPSAPDDLREQGRIAAARAIADDGETEFTALHYGRLASDAVLAVVSPALARRDAEIERQTRARTYAVRERNLHRLRMLRRLNELTSELTEARRVIAAVEALCDDWQRPETRVMTTTHASISAFISAAIDRAASGDGTGEK